MRKLPSIKVGLIKVLWVYLEAFLKIMFEKTVLWYFLEKSIFENLKYL